MQAGKLRGKGQEIDDKIGKTWSDANSKARELKADASAQLNNARSEANKAVDQFDRTVEKKTSEAKSGLSGWFGGSSK